MLRFNAVIAAHPKQGVIIACQKIRKIAVRHLDSAPEIFLYAALCAGLAVRVMGESFPKHQDHMRRKGIILIRSII